jgi:hypothetical protein
MDGHELAQGTARKGTAGEAREILSTLRKCRSRLNSLELHHAAAYADIAIQLLKQSIANLEQEQADS